MNYHILAAETAVQIAAIRDLFTEYAAWLGFSLCFQGFDRELADLPGRYAPPDGRLFLLEVNGAAAGCIALRKIGDGICEMKRLYVRPAFHGLGHGRRLAEHLIAEARAVAYRSMRLDTISRMTAAIALYRALGFREIPPYYDNPIAGAVYMELGLQPA